MAVLLGTVTSLLVFNGYFYPKESQVYTPQSMLQIEIQAETCMLLPLV